MNVVKYSQLLNELTVIGKSISQVIDKNCKALVVDLDTSRRRLREFNRLIFFTS